MNDKVTCSKCRILWKKCMSENIDGLKYIYDDLLFILYFLRIENVNNSMEPIINNN